MDAILLDGPMTEFGSPLGGMGRMLRKLVAGPKRSAARTSSIPDGALVYAVGDIHGCCDLLRLLIEKIGADCGSWPDAGGRRDASAHPNAGGRPIVIFLGDYIDRGPDSRGVIELFLNGLPKDWDFRFLKGNHEEALLMFLRDPNFGAVWRDYGALETL